MVAEARSAQVSAFEIRPLGNMTVSSPTHTVSAGIESTARCLRRRQNRARHGAPLPSPPWLGRNKLLCPAPGAWLLLTAQDSQSCTAKALHQPTSIHLASFSKHGIAPANTIHFLSRPDSHSRSRPLKCASHPLVCLCFEIDRCIPSSPSHHPVAAPHCETSIPTAHVSTQPLSPATTKPAASRELLLRTTHSVDGPPSHVPGRPS
jgi:hypothetical protein